VVCSTLNAWAKRPEIPPNCKHSATVTGAPEPVKNCRPAITAHTFDPPSPSLFEKPNWQIYEETNHRTTTVCILLKFYNIKNMFVYNRFRKMDLTVHYLVNIQYHLVVVVYVILV
jgi:hypothetical protein